MAAVLSGRIEAISRAHALVVRAPFGPVSLRELTDEELQPQLFSKRLSVMVEGPRVALQPAAAQIFALAFHELVANSVEHGLLGEGAGQLDVRWACLIDGALRFEWHERWFPKKRPQRRKGFGTDLLLNALPYQLGASPSLSVKQGRVDAVITLPPGVVAVTSGGETIRSAQQCLPNR
jgi:two-component system CheB/CheR fusion protein